MKTLSITTILFLGSLLLGLNSFASAQADSDALSASFNTVPLGRTSFKYTTVSSLSEVELEAEKEKARLFSCTNNHKLCPKEAPPAPTKTAKKDMLDKVIEATEKLAE